MASIFDYFDAVRDARRGFMRVPEGAQPGPLPAPPLGARPLPPRMPVPAPGLDPFAVMGASVKSRKGLGSVPAFAELARILTLPINPPIDEATVDDVSRRVLLAPVYESGFRLKPKQAASILEYENLGGLFCNVGVGLGKTLITVIVADQAYRKGKKKILLVMPPGVFPQFAERSMAWCRRHAAVSVPFILLGRRGARERRAIAESGKVGCYVMPSSLFSTRDTRTDDEGVRGILDAIGPETIIIDESHEFKDRASARTRRLLDYVRAHHPEGACLSGTITDKHVLDYHHQIRWCLGGYCPLPMSEQGAEDWGMVLDSDADPTAQQMGELLPMVDWARQNYPTDSYAMDRSGFRKAYRHRLTSSKGVVSSGENDIGTSLLVHTDKVPEPKEGPEIVELRRLIEDVVLYGKDPNGDVIEHAFHSYRWLLELSAGFYNRLRWPEPEILVEKRGMEIGAARALVMAARDQHSAQQAYASMLQKWLARHGRNGIDTPMLVGLNMARYGAREVGPDLFAAWTKAKSLIPAAAPPWGNPSKPPAALERESDAVRVCDYKVRRAVEYAQKIVADPKNKGQGVLLWVHHIELGLWVYEQVQAAGLDAMHCPAGDEANDLLGDVGNRHKIVIASIGAHHQGKELQHFQHQYVVQWPRSARVAEQLLGRCHRLGQPADSLTVTKAESIDFDAYNFASCLNDSLYIQQTTGNRQKLMYCAYDPMPRVFPPEMLRERGFEGVQSLDREQETLMHEMFGDYEKPLTAPPVPGSLGLPTFGTSEV